MPKQTERETFYIASKPWDSNTFEVYEINGVRRANGLTVKVDERITPLDCKLVVPSGALRSTPEEATKLLHEKLKAKLISAQELVKDRQAELEEFGYWIAERIAVTREGRSNDR